ncbi:serine-threonine/tyrosine-protein kinase catalytic domain-containing protein [Artemisia annua]|uniref:non-specific serine/threonine protein kinase n=1 Tax=Artemisia annua TaxID=35608 RepID=A0A2U1NZ65_ARTAN|nr:serine-threonine/tyrosine-protein kinase catalytic domain-containing protein [Artemisia annua]
MNISYHNSSVKMLIIDHKSFRLLLSLMLILFTLMFIEVTDVQAQAGFLPQTEKDALIDIAKELGKTDWNFSLNPCDYALNWTWRTEQRSEMHSYNNTLLCNCSYPGGVCHVESLFLKGQDLNGTLPPSLKKLPYIKKIDLTRNYLNGTIPHEWASTKLEYLSLESNMFSGTIPAELGKLENIVNLMLHANNLSGELPVELKNLTNLTELRLSSNNFTGKIPSLESWKRLEKLDLSFNNLNGDIPDLQGLSKLEKMYLTGNSLNGNVPKWIVDGTDTRVVDLSYNHFSKGSVPTSCDKSLDLAKCLGNNRCYKDYYSVYINCGGPEATIGNKVYEADEDPGGDTKFFHDPNSWGFSSTGSQLDVKETEYTSTNVSILTMNNSELYTRARLSPFSLTYYGRCLVNGNYTVTLHFAEISFRDNQSYKSLGRRAFDVYIQVNWCYYLNSTMLGGAS